MPKAERDAILDKFEAEKIGTGKGLLIRTLDIEKDERNAFHLGPDGDYCLFVGPNYEASYTEWLNGTTQITIKKIAASHTEEGK
jgi:hypothetical protein